MKYIFAMKTVSLLTLLTFIFGIMPLFSFSQRYHVTGKVSDYSSSQPISQLSVVDKVSGTGTITTEDGFYSLLLNKGKVDISFTGLIYEPASVRFDLRGDTVVDIRLLQSIHEKNRRFRKEPISVLPHPDAPNP
jgi:hypothetical protein